MQCAGDFAAGRELDILSQDGDVSLGDCPVPASSSHGAGAVGPSSPSQEGRPSAPIDPGRAAPSNDAASADTKDAADDYPSSPPQPSPALSPHHVQADDLSAGDVRVAADPLPARQISSSADGGDAADKGENALPPAAQSVAAAGVDPLSPENAWDPTEVFSGTLDAFAAWKCRRAAPAVPGFTGFQPVIVDAQAAAPDPQPAAAYPHPADVDPHPGDVGPQPAAADPHSVFEADHAIAKEGSQWDSQAAPWVPDHDIAEVQQQRQQAGSLGADPSLLPRTSVSEAAATKQQLQQQLGDLNGNAVPFVQPNLADAKQLHQEKGGMKEGAGPFGRLGAGLLQQQEANSPKIAAVKVNVLSMLCHMFWLLTVIYTQVTVQSHNSHAMWVLMLHMVVF